MPNVSEANNQRSWSSSWAGGFQIGLIGASWPFAKLRVTSDCLQLKCYRGTFEFCPCDVDELRLIVVIPGLGEGIAILHNRFELPHPFIFWTISPTPTAILHEIKNAGFIPQGTKIALDDSDQKLNRFIFRRKLHLGLIFFVLIMAKVYLTLTAR